MKVYILASLDNISFAEKLLSNIRNAKIISKPSINEIGSNINVALKRKMESADVVLAIIDEKFSDSVSLNLELQLAQMSVRENRNKVLIATVYKGNIIKNLIMDCQSYTKYRPNETTGGIFVSWRRKEELPTGA